MKKSYWFEHDYNAANDAKILFLRQQLGMEGYGIYWFIVEQLVQAGGKLPLKVVPVLAMQSQTQESKVSVIITSYELFEIEDGYFFSIRLNGHIETRVAFSEMGKVGAEKRWKNRGANRGANRVAISEGNREGYAKTDRQTDKQNRGVGFSADNTEVIFADGSSQRLGEVQLLELRRNNLLPKNVILGEIE